MEDNPSPSLHSQMPDQSEEIHLVANNEPIQEKKENEDKINQQNPSHDTTPNKEQNQIESANASTVDLNAEDILLIKKEQYIKIENIRGRILCDMPFYFSKQLHRKLAGDFYNRYLILPQEKDQDRIRFSAIFKQMEQEKLFTPEKLKLTLRESRGIGAVLGMAVCDALGSSTQFDRFQKNGLGKIINGFSDIKVGRHGVSNVWTDDASMGLCLADSILLNNYIFNPVHIRYLFTLWLEHGLNNGCRPRSIGLGGNISISMNQFMHKQTPYTFRGQRFNNGNGSLMRLAPVPVAYADNPQKGVLYSGLQSQTTHNGFQAAQCCRLMGLIIISLINRSPQTDGRAVILQVCDSFKSQCQSVVNLAQGKCDSEQLYMKLLGQNPKFKSFNKQIKDRNWNWREQGHTYSPTRLKQQPGYIGSYCMDALSMALHTVWFTNSFKEVAIKNADMGGDCDTVGSIAGQIAGALYGIDQGMLQLYSQMNDFMLGRYQAFLKGYKLINKKEIIIE